MLKVTFLPLYGEGVLELWMFGLGELAQLVNLSLTLLLVMISFSSENRLLKLALSSCPNFCSLSSVILSFEVLLLFSGTD